MSEISSPKSRRVRGSVSVPWELPLVESLEPRLLLSQGFSFNISNIATGASPFSVAAGDFNGDGKTDLVTANDGSNTVSFLPGNGDGTFGAKTDLSMGNTPAGVAASDLNGDGKLDLVVSHFPFGASFTVAFGNGNGTFGAPTTYMPDSSYPVDIVITDFNGDNKPDIAVAGQYSVSMFLNNGSGTFTAGTSFATGAPPWFMSAADVNGDGKMDLLLPNHSSDSVTVFWGNGDGRFLSNTDVATPANSFPYAVIAADVNKDGKLDLVTANSGATSNSVSVLLNNGNGTFGAPKTFAAGSTPYSVVAQDVNGDGNLDLMTANNGAGSVSLLLGNGDGTFGSPTNFAVGANPENIIVASLDGNPDLVVTNLGSGNISVLLSTHTDQTPTVTTSAGAVSYTEGNGAVAVDPGISVSASSATLTGATVTISGNYVSGQDVLGFTNQNGITGSWNGTTGVLTLLGTSSVANYQAALQAVTYGNISGNPSTLARTVSFAADNGTLASAPSSRVVTVSALVGPVVTPTVGPLTYTQGAAVTIDNGITLTDASSTTLIGATVTITGNYAGTQDVLGFGNQNGITGIRSGNVLTLSGSASVSNYQAALRSITYNDTSATPSTLPRTVTFVANDGTSASDPVTRVISMTPINSPPVVTPSSGSVSYVQGTGAVTVDGGITITDGQSATLSSAQVSIGGYAGGQDTLKFTDQNGITGSWNAATGVLTLSGSASVANYQAALRSVTYNNTAANPSTAARTISFVVSDNFSSSTVVTRTVTVTAVSVPVVTVSAGALSYLRGSGALTLDSGITVSDSGSGSLVGATLTISSPNYSSSQDVLSFTSQNGITGSWNAATGVLTLSGSASVASYQAALRSVTYTNTSANPSTLARSIRIVANDGNALSTPAARIVNVNVPPVLTTSAGAMSYSQGADPAVDSAITVSDAESANLVGATISITGGFVSGQDMLGFVNQNGITGSWDAALGVLTLSGTASAANYQTALQSVTYLNTSTAPNTQDRTVSFAVNDGILPSTLATRTIQLTLGSYVDLTGVLVGGTSWTIPSKPVVADKAFAGYAQVKVSNIGNKALPLSQTVVIQVIAQDTSNPANSILLATSNKLSVSKLAVNGSVTFRQYVSVPKGLAAGNYQIVLNIIPTNLTESRTDNNQVSLTAGGLAEPLTVAAQVVDLTAAFGASLKLPTKRIGGDGYQIYVPVVVKNIGNVALLSGQKIDIQIEASGNGGTTLLKTLLGVSVSSLGAQASATFGTYVTLPFDLSPGTYKLLTVVDSSQKVLADPNRNNNTVTSTGAAMTVAKGYEDLSGSKIGTSTLRPTVSAASAPVGSVSVVVKNIGNVPMPTGQSGSIRLIAHNTATNANITLTTLEVQFGAMAVNATKQFTLSVNNLPAGLLPAGTYTVQATISPDNMTDFNSSIYTVLTNALGRTLVITVTA